MYRCDGVESGGEGLLMATFGPGILVFWIGPSWPPSRRTSLRERAATRVGTFRCEARLMGTMKAYDHRAS